jgi:putative ABC transport system permease protein
MDFRFAIRHLRRSPAFTAAALLTLGLGIGAVTSVTTLVNAVLIQSLPFDDPDRIVFLRGLLRRDTPTAYPLGYQDLAAVAARQDIFSAVSPVTGLRSFNMTVGADVEHVDGEMVGARYFDALGVTLAHGRSFTAEESRAQSAAQVAVIAHQLWIDRFGGDASVVGKTIALNDRTFEIVGVAPEGFRGLTDGARVWVPIGMSHAIYGSHYTEMRQFRWLSGVARVADGVSLEQARAALDTTMKGLEQEWPKENARLGMTATPLSQTFFGEVRTPLLALLGAAAFVLLIGCLNVANLLLARGSSRARELSVRLALGAGRGRLVRQLLTESLVLVAVGSTVGIALAWVLASVLSSLARAELASFLTVRIDSTVLAIAVIVSVVSALIFGLMPALTASALSPLDGLREEGRSATGGLRQRRFQVWLVAGEVTLSLALVAGAALMTKGLARHLRTEVGFEPDRLITMRMDLTADRYKDNQRFWQTARAVAERASEVAGVEALTIEGPGFPTSGFYGISFRHEEAPPEAPDVTGLRHHVTPGYFATLGIRLLAGRDFGTQDVVGSPGVLVVSDAFARRYFAGKDPVGQRLLTLGPTPLPMTIVGVVADVRHSGLSTDFFEDPHVYVSLYQYPARTPATLTLIARAATDPSRTVAPLRAAVRAAAPELAPYDVLTMEERLERQTARGRYAVVVMAGFAVLALALAAIGIYGLISYTVAQRTREIGVRMALGANRREVVWLVLRKGAFAVLGGVAVGLVIVGLGARLIAGLLYGLDPVDPPVLLITALVLTVIGLCACVIPALRAARIEPVSAMRE